MPEKQAFGDILAGLRQAKGLTQQEVGDLIGVTRSAVYGFEKGRSFPVPDKLVKLARYFGVTVDYMLTGENPPQQAPKPAPPNKNVQDSGTPQPALAEGLISRLSTEEPPADSYGEINIGVSTTTKTRPAGPDLAKQIGRYLKQADTNTARIEEHAAKLDRIVEILDRAGLN